MDLFDLLFFGIGFALGFGVSRRQDGAHPLLIRCKKTLAADKLKKTLSFIAPIKRYCLARLCFQNSVIGKKRLGAQPAFPTGPLQIAPAFHQQHQYLSDAADHMADGIAIFDQSGYLVFTNKRYSAFFPKTADIRVPGTHFLDILQASIDRGEEPRPAEDFDLWKGRVYANLHRPGSRMMEFKDGRAIEARWGVSERGNIFVNYSDATKAREYERRLLELNNRLRALADTDGLTGLANRRNFDDRMRSYCEDEREEELPLSIMLMDVDNFKSFNDNYGHQAGDECLIKIASSLRSAIEGSPMLAARYGGEEMAVIMPRTDLPVARVLCERLRLSVQSLRIPHFKSRTGFVSASAGVATTAIRANVERSLLAAADKALYSAKAAGRNCVASVNLEAA